MADHDTALVDVDFLPEIANGAVFRLGEVILRGLDELLPSIDATISVRVQPVELLNDPRRTAPP
jgi:hypothetical protein